MPTWNLFVHWNPRALERKERMRRFKEDLNPVILISKTFWILRTFSADSLGRNQQFPTRRDKVWWTRFPLDALLWSSPGRRTMYVKRSDVVWLRRRCRFLNHGFYRDCCSSNELFPNGIKPSPVKHIPEGFFSGLTCAGKPEVIFRSWDKWIKFATNSKEPQAENSFKVILFQNQHPPEGLTQSSDRN